MGRIRQEGPEPGGDEEASSPAASRVAARARGPQRPVRPDLPPGGHRVTSSLRPTHLRRHLRSPQHAFASVLRPYLSFQRLLLLTQAGGSAPDTSWGLSRAPPRPPPSPTHLSQVNASSLSIPTLPGDQGPWLPQLCPAGAQSVSKPSP